MRLGEFSFSGYAVILNEKLGYITIGNDQVLPAIYLNKQIAHANLSNDDAVVIKAEVYSDGSVILVSNKDEILAPRTFNVELLMNVNLKLTGLRLLNKWVGFIQHSEFMRTPNISLYAKHDGE